MSGKTMEVSRELLERVTNNQFLEKERISIARHEALFELRGLLAKTACIDCKETGFCLSIMGDEIRCPCHAPIQFAKPDELQAEPAAQPQGDGVNWKVVANEQKGIIEQQQNLIASLRAELSGSYRIDSKPQGEPLIHITPEVLAMLSGERKMQPGGLTYSGSKPLCGWTVPLYTEQPAPVADSTTSDKYKAELYEEVWQLARGMGFGNVTDALMKAEKQHAPVAVVPDGYCIMPRRLTAENGAKALLLGEFKLQVTKECPECRELDEPTEGCEICDGEGDYGQQYTISWDQIKFIYSKAVEGLAVKAETDKP